MTATATLPAAAARRVHLALFVTMAVWGLNLSAVKLLTESLDILLVAAVRMTLAAAVLAAVGRWQGHGLPTLRRDGWWLAVLAAFLLVYVQQIAFAAGLARTSATNAALVMTLGPMVSVLLEARVFRRPVHARQAAGIGMALAGVALVILNRPNAALTQAAWGDLWIFCSVVGFATGGLCLQKLTRDTTVFSISILVHVVGAAMLWTHVAFGVPDALQQVAAMGARQWAMVGYSGVFATALGALVWARGIATLGVGRTASYLSWLPVFGVAFGALVLSETITHWHLLGLAGVLVGSVWSARR